MPTSDYVTWGRRIRGCGKENLIPLTSSWMCLMWNTQFYVAIFMFISVISSCTHPFTNSAPNFWSPQIWRKSNIHQDNSFPSNARPISSLNTNMLFFLRHLPKKITFLGYIYQRIRSHVNQYVECWLEGMWSFIQAFQLDSQPFTTETIWQRTSTAVTKFIKPRSFRFIWLPSCWRNVLFFKSCLQEPAKYTGKLV